MSFGKNSAIFSPGEKTIVVAPLSIKPLILPAPFNSSRFAPAPIGIPLQRLTLSADDGRSRQRKFLFCLPAAIVSEPSETVMAVVREMFGGTAENLDRINRPADFPVVFGESRDEMKRHARTGTCAV